MTWLVIGGGISGRGAAHLLRKKGQTVRISDGAQLGEAVKAELIALGVDVRDGGHEESHLENITHVVLSPGLPLSHPLVVKAKSLGLALTSEIDLGLKDYSGKVFAVTGTNGKSTTCAMLAHCLTAAGHKAALAGNIGMPPSELAAKGDLPQAVVLELSSYQLETTFAIRPSAAMITSFSHDHMSRHGTLKNYLAAKWRVVELLSEDGILIITSAVRDAANGWGFAPFKGVTCVSKSSASQVVEPGDFCVENDFFYECGKDPVDLKASGQSLRHNQLNGIFGYLAARHVFKTSLSHYLTALTSYHGLKHRCEIVGTLAGRKVINDSKSTNLESTLSILNGFVGPIVLLLGGLSKGESFSPISAFSGLIKEVVTFGKDGLGIATDIRGIPVAYYSKMDEAVQSAIASAKAKHAALLFSPGCASFDGFRNFEHRGEVFTELVTPFLDKS